MSSRSSISARKPKTATETEIRRSGYGARPAVTSRTCGTMVSPPATRRHEASKFGQVCCEQSGPSRRMSSRSPLASAWGTEASTCGAKPPREVRPAATNVTAAIADNALIMKLSGKRTHGPGFCRRFRNQRRLRDPFTRREKWFHPARLCFVGPRKTKHAVSNPSFQIMLQLAASALPR